MNDSFIFDNTINYGEITMPFIATIQKKNASTGHITKSYREFSSMVDARTFLYKGVMVLKAEEGYTLHDYDGENLLYSDRNGHKIHIGLKYQENC